MRVRSYPPLWWFENEESGIKRVVEAYHKYLPDYGIQFVGPEEEADIVVSHAGSVTDPHVVHTHGLYWSADFKCTKAELHTNQRVIESCRKAKEVTTPSEWVQKVFQRDMRFSPHVIPHGIDMDEWEHDHDYEQYVLWNKNRDRDVCSPDAIYHLAANFPHVHFKTTFAPHFRPDMNISNVEEIGVVPHEKMKGLVQKAGVYLSTTKETFGIGILEAMASGVPVLGFDHGGNSELVQHGVNGYLAEPGDYQGLLEGLEYCIYHRSILGKNGIELVREYTWERACQMVAEVYEMAHDKIYPSVSVVVPVYNYADKVVRAIDSALDQELEPEEVVVVDDGSTDDTAFVVKEIAEKNDKVKYVYQENAGVAHARNNGVWNTSSKYVCCLDADDAIAPEFLRVCVDALEKDNSLGLAYTGLYSIKPDGEKALSPWPGEWKYDDQLRRKNQIPTCNVMRRKMFDRLGGYRQRYAPHGAGSEDAELWLRVGAYGWKAEQVDKRGLFIYSWLSGIVSGNPDYHEKDWMGWHPWTRDSYHPFASYATPENQISHPVRQYDEPEISVIIPVGPKHGGCLVNALDSLEAQTFRRWEAIVVFDGCKNIEYFNKTFPHIKTVINDGSPKGAGWARNRGVDKAEGGLVLFLDADDWLHPDALDKFYYAYEHSRQIVYSNYLSKGYMSGQDAESFGSRLVEYDEKLEIGTIRYRGLDFDCELAQLQPQDPDKPYIWNLITSLVPIQYHYDIGGFDEDIESWEDWDYWIRMARNGKCFHLLDEELVTYNFDTGTRRAMGRKIGEDLVNYLQRKYRRSDVMGCDCNNKKVKTASGSTVFGENVDMNDEDFILCTYNHRNRGQHKVFGGATKKNYGYYGAGAKFYVHKDDIALQPKLFVPVQKPKPKKKREKAKPPELLKKEKMKVADDLTEVPGVSNRIAGELNALGIHTFDSLTSASLEELMSIKGIGKATAQKMKDFG